MTDRERLIAVKTKIEDQLRELGLSGTMWSARAELEDVLKFVNYLLKESSDFDKILEEEWKDYINRGVANIDAHENNPQKLAFSKGFTRGWIRRMKLC